MTSPPLEVLMLHRLSFALLLLTSSAALAAEDDGHAHGAAHAKGGGKKDLDALPAADRARAQALDDTLARLASAAKARSKSSLVVEQRKQGEAARKASFSSTKALYGTRAFATAAPKMAAIASDVVPERLASPLVAWLTDACDPARGPALELRYALCAELYAQEASAHPADWRLHRLWSEANAHVGQADTAFLAAWMVAELRPRDAGAWYRAAQLGLLADAPKEATGAVHRAMQLEVDEVFLAGFAESLAKRKALPTAVQLLENAIARKPGSGRLLAMQALLMAGAGRADLALRAIERATRTGYEGADLYLAWGHALYQQKKLDEAAEKFRSAVALDPAAKADVPPELRGKL